ncbi:Energy-coupling factor transporter ATP-binding protein EcfA2 [bioreactor metagenome]|uniref:Energy-coupling factor transporter ATP-binding protein EcfA2 n=1 Tax=bioreactor metagenome TaxID=1076179 RepID=A0A644TNJ9_9ZZZZ|nr:energy-coupling factor transporter ATPase [Negativicutes bacterium]
MSIVLDHISYTYMPETPYERTAIKDITLEINQGEFIAIIGHTGSGKSTLVQHLNGLLKPTAGSITVDGVNINKKSAKAKAACRKVGMVFQYAEHQLFEETVYDDIAFGPRNQGVDEEFVQRRVQQAMEFVGLDVEGFSKRSPFTLSGGQMRRVAIAGVIALNPEYLILDEPSAGLDPKGRDEIFQQIMELFKATGIAVVLVSHNMEDVARMATRLIVMNHGEICLDGTPSVIFKNNRDQLKAAGVDVPNVTALMSKLKDKGLCVQDDVLTVEQATEAILAAVRRQC